MGNLGKAAGTLMRMGRPRKAMATLQFNGKNVDTSIRQYLESVTYEDVASGSSDTLSIKLQNITKQWMEGWYPGKGDEVSGDIKFLNWTKTGKTEKIHCGVFTLDEIGFSGNPMTVSFGCVSAPACESFKTRDRTKTWEKVTIQAIAGEIAGRYKLSLSYSGPAITIEKLEQSENDSSFLFGLCGDYGLSMKVYKKKIVIYSQTEMEQKAPVSTLTMDDFIDNDWEATDSLYGTYTGARISYKNPSDNKETSIYVGLKAEGAKGSRVLRINETAESVAEARLKAAAKVNKSNEGGTTLTGSIWPDPKICAGVTVRLEEFGKFNGKYFVDKCTIEISGSGTSQKIEMHKCQKRLTG